MIITIKPDKIRTLHDKINFGKYRGHLIKWILENDPSYLVWLQDETDRTDFTKNIKERLGEYKYGTMIKLMKTRRIDNVKDY